MTDTSSNATRLWSAWPVASFVSLLIGAIALFNTGDTSPWGIEWIILPIALVILTLVDLIPRTILKRAVASGFVLPVWFTALLQVHWYTPAALIVSAVLWKVGILAAPVLAPVILIVYITTGVILTAGAVVLRRRPGRNI